jgi:large subunit ribosomal protein L15
MQNKLAPPPGAKHKIKRIGRGLSSGHGRTAGKGSKGQKARAGCKVRPGFEGGQNPLTKRLPELRGFNNIFRIEYSTVNVSHLNRFEAESEVTPQRLVAEGLIKSSKQPVKIIGDGEIKKPLIIRANRFTKQARIKIESAGGKAEEIGSDTRAKRG